MSRLDTPHDLTTMQGVFDYVAENLSKQGRRSTDGEMCMYRDPNGCKCAAGWLIPDDLYHGDLEGNILSAYDADPDDAGVRISSIILAAFDERIPHTYEMRELIHDLQMIHDRPDTKFEAESDWLTAWRKRMRGYAETMKLDPKALEAA